MQRWQDSQTLTTCEEQAWKPLETKPHRSERCPRGRGASVSHRTVQAAVDSEDKTNLDWTPEPKNEKSGPTAGRQEQPLRERADLQLVRRAWPTASRQRAISLQSKKQETTISRIEIPPGHSALNKIVEMPGARTSPDSPDSAQSLEAQQLQFIDEDIQIRFRISWRFFSCSTLMRRSIPLLGVQKSAWTPQDQSNEKRVYDTVIMQTSSSSPS